MYDAHGNEYLDFAAGIAVNALGERLTHQSRQTQMKGRIRGVTSVSMKPTLTDTHFHRDKFPCLS